MTTLPQIAHLGSTVKKHVVELVENGVTDILNRASPSGRELEEAVWNLVTNIGAELLQGALSLACLRVTRDLVGDEPVRVRKDKDYTISQTTTLGPVSVVVFAYRDSAGKTHAPGRDVVFPMHPLCRSSELCLQWEARLGCAQPFRQAQQALTFFTHGKAKLEDTTIARHSGVVGTLISRKWTCRSPEDIAKILTERATRDGVTGKPVLYASTDAHALRRYVDNTWKASWKMFNGIRLWCVDRITEQVIHVGGEYTWGDCREVAKCMKLLMAELLPTGDSAPQVVFIADGMPWIRDHVHPVMPKDTRFILDFYHVMEQLGTYAKARFGRGTSGTKTWLARVKKKLLGKRNYRRKRQNERRGHTKSSPRRRRSRTIHLSEKWSAGESLIRQLVREEPESDQLLALVGYLCENIDRIDFPAYRQRGLQVGSGAMESLHRVASQVRLKRSGARWMPERAVAITNLRLMMLAERWDAFWGQEDLQSTLRDAFASNSVSAA